MVVSSIPWRSASSPASGNVHVVDDDDSFRRAISRLLQALGYSVHGYSSATEFLMNSAGNSPGCVLLDVKMPGMNGMALQAFLAKNDDSPPVVFVTGHGDIPMSVRAMKTGAVDFLTKPVRRESLVHAIESALARDAESRAVRRPMLSDREIDVLLLLRDRLRNKEIARRLYISAETVKKHTFNIYRKLGVAGRREAVLAAITCGIIPES